ncbi:molecular chaperone HtpG [Alloiococcus sp. CFN-8]|uniref:molecular chaperone HtpG n=1 Tax=Alloiococcus sp. CFN-8 TaxID=3416081 RepID=UPI003CF180B6
MKSSGVLSVESKNIFAILKKWLYTEQDIVFRELISNSCDAIQKLNLLKGHNGATSMDSEGSISVTLDTDKNKIIISDNGIGMTSEEVNKYINQVAFSGATDFINRHNSAGKDSIIGHFGVGFYSSFMVSDHVSIETKSYIKNESPVRWDCHSDMSYEMAIGEKTTPGTDIILHINKDSEYIKKPSLLYDIIKKYFIFSKVKIYYKAPEFDNVLINLPDPIWRKPKELIDKEEMNSFYKDFFNDIQAPLSWIKFESIDIGIRGIIFFRNTKNGKEELDGSFKVYSRGVYIGENIKELIPKFVNLQSGIIECDDLPLVVSRSNLREGEIQNNALGIIKESLSQEVTIAVNDMFVSEREFYEMQWPHLNAFVKYGILQDKIFSSVMTQKVIFQDINGSYLTLKEYINDEKNNHKDTVYYSSDALEQAHYIEIFKRCGLNALLFDHVIDQPLMRRQELVHPNIKFIRIDSNIGSLFEGFIGEEDKNNIKIMTEKINHALGSRLLNMTLRVTNLEQKAITTLIINDEKSRRMTDMLEIYGIINKENYSAKELQAGSTYVVNLKSPIISFVLKSSQEVSNIILNQLFDLALLSQGKMELEDTEPFIIRSEKLLESLVERSIMCM